MKRLLITVALCLGFAISASAQTITLIPDKAVYEQGDLIFLTSIADAQGMGGQTSIFGRLGFAPSLGFAVGVQTIPQFLAGNPLGPVTSLGGTLPWQAGNHACGTFGCTAFNHSQGATTHPPDAPAISTMVLFANLPTVSLPGGCIQLNWIRAGGFALDFYGVSPAASPDACITILLPPFAADLDVKPLELDDPADPEGKNPINLGGGTIPVAVYGSTTFDVTNIDASTIAFGPAGAIETHGTAHLEDVNGDLIDDLKLHFDTDESGIQFGDFTVCLTADLLSPLPTGETRIEACDNIAVR
jgi:hypothetical protein